MEAATTEKSGLVIGWISDLIAQNPMLGTMTTTVLRWVFIILAMYILIRSILSLLQSKNPSEIWAYMHTDDGQNIPITHWENVIGRAANCDISVDHLSVSRNHGTLIRNHDESWTYKDLRSKNGSEVNGERVLRTAVKLRPGDVLKVGSVSLTLFPISLEEQQNNTRYRLEKAKPRSPWKPIIVLTLFQVLTALQLIIAVGPECPPKLPICLVGLGVVMWGYFIFVRTLGRSGFETETIAFFLSTLSLAVTASANPDEVPKQLIAVLLGVGLFFGLCWYLRDLDRAKSIRNWMIIGSVTLLIINLAFGTLQYGAANWVAFAGLSFQPSELVKIAFIYVGAATLDELFKRNNLIIFVGLSAICLGSLALMGDFGTAAIFFVSFLVISFLRSGDFSKLILIIGAAVAGGMMLLRFKPYIAKRFEAWGHVWQYADSTGYQQTRTMTASASGGVVGVGAGNGWLSHIFAADKDLVFGVLVEEWGLIIAVLSVACIVTLCVFATRNIMAGRSTFYTIAACSAMSMLLFQTILNVFGSVDLLPLTGVTFPFVSNGGTSMLSSWGLLAFLKASDTRQNASFAVRQSKVSKKVEYDGPSTDTIPEMADEEDGVIEVKDFDDLFRR